MVLIISTSNHNYIYKISKIIIYFKKSLNEDLNLKIKKPKEMIKDKQDRELININRSQKIFKIKSHKKSIVVCCRAQEI